MRGIMILAVVVGIVCIPWTYFIITFGLPLWASFLGAAIFFAGGGGKEGLVKALPACLLGVVFAAGTAFAAASVPGGSIVLLSIFVGIAALFIVLLSGIGIFSFIPGSFLGFATTFAVMTAFNNSGITQQSVYSGLGIYPGF